MLWLLIYGAFYKYYTYFIMFDFCALLNVFFVFYLCRSILFGLGPLHYVLYITSFPLRPFHTSFTLHSFPCTYVTYDIHQL